jgi:hypothetical protein
MLLFAILPGLFFEASILLANPALVYTLVARAQPFIGTSHYATLGLALFLAFIISNAFIFLVLVSQTLLGYLYRLRAVMWGEFCTWAVYPLISRLQEKPWWSRRQTLRHFALYVGNVRIRHSGVDLDRDTRHCWALLARRLLKDRYNLEAADLDQDDWNVLYDTLGPLSLADVRGDYTVIAYEAIGWSGLAATLLAPALRNRYYVSLSIVLIVWGLLHDWHVVGNVTNPRFLGFLKIRTLLREYQNTTERKG